MSLTPTEYLCDKFSCKPEEVIEKSVLHLCGELPPNNVDPEKYFERNNIKHYDERTDFAFQGRLFPCVGFFTLAINPEHIKDANEKNFVIWHEMSHTLFYRFDGEYEIPYLEITRNDEEAEKICDNIAEYVHQNL